MARIDTTQRGAAVLDLADRPDAADQPDVFDRAMLDAQVALDRARRNPWLDGDLTATELTPVLSAIVAPRPMTYGVDFAPGPAWRGHRNRWREVLRPAG
jgi:hypothetical protein